MTIIQGRQNRLSLKKLLSNSACAIFIGGASLTFGTISAYAQETQEAQTEFAPEDVVVVTGSLIRSRKKDFKTPSPVQTLDKTQFADTGAARVQDLFKGITANSGSQIANSQNNLQGLSQFSLRGLGIGSTLTLVNGRRAGLAPITDSSGQLFTDSNQFPVNAISRVEVLTDGASSTYGSEAVAGVVNFFTRDDFDGFELTSEARTSIVDSVQVGVGFGGDINDDKGHIVIFGNYFEQSGAARSEFDFIAEGNRLEDGTASLFDSATGSPGRFSLAIPDANAAGGFIRGAQDVADPDCVAAGGFIDGNNCRYNFLGQVRSIAEETRLAVFSRADYDITDSLNVFGEVNFSRNEIRDGIGGTLTRQTTVGGGFLVPESHPFNFFVEDGNGGITFAGPDAFAANPNLQAANIIYRGRPFGADADGDNLQDIQTVFTNLRLTGGFDYSINDDWVLTGSYVWANSDFSRAQPNEYDIPAFQDAIIGGFFNPFGTRVSNPGLVSPRDGVSLAGNSQDVIDTFALIRNDSAQVTQSVAEGILSGVTGIELPGGNISLAVGGQYRKIDLEDIPDGRFQAGTNRLNITVPAVFGTQDVYAVFGEVVLPVTDRLEVQGALRFEDYGEAQGGDTLDPKLSAKFDVTDNIAIRGSYGTSFQAPSIRQAAGVVSSATINDPADPGGGAFIITVVTQGSPDLTPQSAENFNIGGIFRTDSGLNLSVDYWNYDYSGLILPGADPQFIFDEVFAGNLPGDRATRDGVGQPATAIAQFENQGSAQASGFDIVGRYRFDAFTDSTITLDASSTIITRYNSSEFGDIKGSRNFSNGFGSTPDFKANAGITLDKGVHNVNVTGRYIGSYTDDQSDNTIEDQLTIDARWNVQLDDFLGFEGTNFGVGVTNLFDVDPPALTGRPLFDQEVHDPRGRQVFVTLKQNF